MRDPDNRFEFQRGWIGSMCCCVFHCLFFFFFLYEITLLSQRCCRPIYIGCVCGGGFLDSLSPVDLPLDGGVGEFAMMMTFDKQKKRFLGLFIYSVSLFRCFAVSGFGFCGVAGFYPRQMDIGVEFSE